MKLDRDYQRKLLEQLAESYPRYHDVRTLLDDMDEAGEERYIANMIYLEEHGLVKSGISFALGGESMFTLPKITAAGMDFLADDGGLGAILGVLTVRLHADTMRELITAKIDSAPIPPEEKSRIKRHLETLSQEALKVLAKSLMEKGLAHLPDAVQWLQTTLAHLPK